MRFPRKQRPAGIVHDGAKLLIFAAGLLWQFRFVPTVTILQQTIHGLSRDRADSGPLCAARARKAEGITARRLPKSWANAGAFSLLTPKSKLAQY